MPNEVGDVVPFDICDRCDGNFRLDVRYQEWALTQVVAEVVVDDVEEET